MLLDDKITAIVIGMAGIIAIQSVIIYGLYGKLSNVVSQILAYAAFKNEGVGAAHAVLAASKLQGIANKVPQEKKKEKEKPKEPPFTITQGLYKG